MPASVSKGERRTLLGTGCTWCGCEDGNSQTHNTTKKNAIAPSFLLDCPNTKNFQLNTTSMQYKYNYCRNLTPMELTCDFGDSHNGKDKKIECSSFTKTIAWPNSYNFFHMTRSLTKQESLWLVLSLTL